MSTAKLNVWVTEVGNGCKIDMKNQWFVHVLHCNGEILDWCGRKFTNLPTKCGHLEIDIPPGCYMVCATWSPAPVTTNLPTTLGNHISHLSMVRANCGNEVCVTLFPPTFHHCGIWWEIALRENIKLKRLPRNANAAAEAALRAVEELRKVLPAADEVTTNMMQIAENPPRVK